MFSIRFALPPRSGRTGLVLVPGLILSAMMLFTSAGAPEVEDSEAAPLVVYTYDSFVSEWGPGPQIEALFEEETGIALELVGAGDAGQMLGRAIREGADSDADVILGLDQTLFRRAQEAQILAEYRSPMADSLAQGVDFEPAGYLTPFDYGHFAIIYDSEAIDTPPESLEDLTDGRFADSLILMDPRTSSPGLGFLMWTIEVYGEAASDYWQRLQPSILTVTDGWDSGYGLFTSGEAPMVLSYGTSPAYHLEYEETRRYRAAAFEDGHMTQIEGAGILAWTDQRDKAEAFIDFMLSESFQEVIPLTNWMFPARADASLPDSYSIAMRPEQQLFPPQDVDIDAAIDMWLEALGR